MKFSKPVGIVSYGTYIPAMRITGEQIAQLHGEHHTSVPKQLGVYSKSVPAADEDAITMAIEAGAQCLDGWTAQQRAHIGALFIGSESHPYAVKPSGTVVAHALGLPETLAMADLQFACKAGIQALLICAAYSIAGMAPYGLAIGSDTAQAEKGDVLEFTASSGAACFSIGTTPLRARLIGSLSLATDTPDFWRKPGYDHPHHAGRFSGEPGYFAHTLSAAKKLMNELSLQPTSIDYCVFHTPNAKFPKIAASKLGFTPQQLQHSLPVETIGNTYSAAAMIALANVLDHAKKHDRILLTSYGSGSGSDALFLEVQ